MINITLAIALPWLGDTWPVGEGISPAVLKAVKEINSDPTLLPNHNLAFVFLDTRCDSATGTSLFESAYHLFRPDVFIGPACSSVVNEIFTDQDLRNSSWKLDVPMISYSAASPLFGDKTIPGMSGTPGIYLPFSRTVPDYTMQNQALVSLCMFYGFESVGVVYTSDTGLWGPTHKDLVEQLGASSVKIETFSHAVMEESAGTTAADSAFTTFMVESLASGTKAFVFLGYCDAMARWTELTESADLLKGISIFVYEFSSSCAKSSETSAATGLAKYEGLWNLSPKVPSTLADFKSEILSDQELDFSPYLTYPYGTAAPLNTSEYKDEFIAEMEKDGGADRSFQAGIVPDQHAAFLYDAIWMYARSQHVIIEEMIKPLDVPDPFIPDGEYRLPVSTVNKHLRAETFDGASGDVELNLHGNRMADIQFSFIEVGRDDLEKLVRVDAGSFQFRRDAYEQTADTSLLRWPGGVVGVAAPGATTDNVLHGAEGESNILVPIALGVGGIFALFSFALYYFHTKDVKRLETAQQRVTRLGSVLGHERTRHSKLVQENVEMKKTLQLYQAYTVKEKEMIEQQHEELKDHFGASGELQRLLISSDELGENVFLGKGSFGEVFKSKYHGSYVAVKTMHSIEEESLERFREEILLQSGLRHDNIVGLVGACWETKLMALVMEFCSKGTSDNILASEGDDLTWGDPLLMWSLNVSNGMHYLHSMQYFDVKANKEMNGIIHRDLKPDNCLITESYRLKIADFGEARELDDENTMTQVGTPLYTAPEVLKGYRYTFKADVYSFAMTLLQFALKKEKLKDFLRGKLPNNANNRKAISVGFVQHKMVSIDWRPALKELEDDGTPWCIVGLIKLCWLPDPDDRPAFSEIEHYLGGQCKKEILGAAASYREATGSVSLGVRVAEIDDSDSGSENNSDKEEGDGFWQKKCAVLEEKVEDLREALNQMQESGNGGTERETEKKS
ncbi:hypothetical protein TrRE_jg8255 [Triparma retinervis]|uniref:Protein kinase domain-containing protein n=1 Tax=Triparma retinervis TaxID=2557542 RepID=A0A9W7DMT4_9STRA|nr:hypothetical protein TrRE_jg8255 [Triparma retinervis]